MMNEFINLLCGLGWMLDGWCCDPDDSFHLYVDGTMYSIYEQCVPRKAFVLNGPDGRVYADSVDEFDLDLLLELGIEGEKVRWEEWERFDKQCVAARASGKCSSCMGSGYSGPHGDCCGSCEGSGWPID